MAVRGLLAALSFTLVVLATLAVAIGANTVIFSVVNGILLPPLPFADPGRLVAVHARDAKTSSNVSARDFLDWRQLLGAVIDPMIAMLPE